MAPTCRSGLPGGGPGNIPKKGIHVLVIDPSQNWNTLEKRLEKETNPTFRRQLEEVIFHIRVEAELNVERALQRLSPQAEYRLYDNANSTVILTGVDEIRKTFYEESLLKFIHHDFQWSIDRVVVDDGIVITEGDLKVALRGSVLVAAGVDADPAKFYLSESHHVVMWPFDDEGRLIGEQNYYGYTSAPEDVVKRPLALEEIGTVTGHTPDLD